MSYWLDSDVLVFAKDTIAPIGYKEFAGFWELIERNMETGIIRITKRNFQEITEGRKTEDDLAKWLRPRKGAMIGVPPTKEVQAFAAKIGDYVYSTPKFYERHRARFSRGADAWLIAQAAVEGGIVVTREVSQPGCHAPKIPDLCIHFKVKFVSLIELMKILGSLESSPPGKK
ncbi:MAG: DUF4411 family protein [Terracidiphilus sp.]